MDTDGLVCLANEISRAEGVDQTLVKAIIKVESDWNTWAVRYEPLYAYFLRTNKWARSVGVTENTERQMQRMSWGLMQVMGSVCRELNFKYILTRMCEPEHGISLGCKVIRRKMARYSETLDVIASYNAGSAIKLTDGSYRNQTYVNKVIAEIENIKKMESA